MQHLIRFSISQLLTTGSIAALAALAAGCGSRTITAPNEYATPVRKHDAGGGLSRTPPKCGGGTECGPTSCWSQGSGRDNCGASKSESCCTSPNVPGGTFLRSYDGKGLGTSGYSASVSTFRLDKFEVTVGRFRKFIESWTGSNTHGVTPWRPASGLGKHDYLGGGLGLAVGTSADGGTLFESGWDEAWNSMLADSPSTWTANLTTKCGTKGGPPSWTAAPGTSEDLPVNCVTWQEAYAFCIWDDGFLPSEAEWNFAASGGAEQREFPWSGWGATGVWDAGFYGTGTPPECGFANFAVTSDGGVACPVSPPRPVRGGASSPLGDSKWGQADLGGNVAEWVQDSTVTFDSRGPVNNATGYAATCIDCASADGPRKIFRGGSFAEAEAAAKAGIRSFAPPGQRTSSIGFRCARAPK